MKHTSEFEALCDDARQRVQELDIDTLLRRQAAGEPLVLVDVREESEWSKGHLPGAIHLGKGVIERDIVGRCPDKGAELVLYCGGGYRSLLAGDSVQRMGYTRIRSLIGGWRLWKERGLPTEG
jgi:rhodanese-related sulfurtransferase